MTPLSLLRGLAIAAVRGPSFVRTEAARWLLGCNGSAREVAAWPHQLRRDIDVLRTHVDQLSRTVDTAADIAIALAPLVGEVNDVRARLDEFVLLAPDEPTGKRLVGEDVREERP